MKFKVGDKVSINKQYCRNLYRDEGWDKNVIDFTESSGICTITHEHSGSFYKLKEDVGYDGDGYWWSPDELTTIPIQSLPDELFQL